MTQKLYRDQPTSRDALRAKPRRRVWLAGLLGLAGLGLAGWTAGGRGTTVQTVLFANLPDGAAKPAFTADCSVTPTALQQDLTALAGSFDGVVGIGVAKAGCDWLAGVRQDAFFPQQSVSKLWVSLAVLDAADKGRISLDQAIAIRPQDLTLFHQPLRAEVAERGVAVRSVSQLMFQALTQSDNTANDRLLWTIGGPGQVRKALHARALDEINFGPGERLLQSAAAGLAWQQDMALGNNFEIARARLPLEVRKTALQRYLAAPPDGATPAGMAQALARLAAGDLLSPGSTRIMLDILAKTHSGPRRLKAGAPQGWQVFHKTGTGQELRGLATGYNDVGLLKAPDGSIYAVAVMIGETRRPVIERMELMQAVSAAVGRFHESAPG